VQVVKTLDDLPVEGKRVLVRVDFNVPMAEDENDGWPVVADDTRIRAALPTIERLRERGARIILVSHLGRPKNRDPELSLRPVAERLDELTDAKVTFAADVVGEEARAAADAVEPGDIVLLENVRYEPGETKNDPELAQALGSLADVFVNDAFGTAHRAHASTVGVVDHVDDAAAGLLLQKEVETLTRLLEAPERPLVAVLGGAKVTDKIDVIDRFLNLADTILIGGAMCFPFLRAQGHPTGSSLCEQAGIEPARRALEASKTARGKLELPGDLRLGERFDPDTRTRDLDGVDVPDGWMGLDIGSWTANRYARAIANARTVFWNGPMGAFELPEFADGTRTVAQAVAETSATTVVGGGDSVAALKEFGLTDQIDWVSTGGGASLELIEGRALPGIEALRDTTRESAQ
jgi:phosphoglycerate kinase